MVIAFSDRLLIQQTALNFGFSRSIYVRKFDITMFRSWKISHAPYLKTIPSPIFSLDKYDMKTITAVFSALRINLFFNISSDIIWYIKCMLFSEIFQISSNQNIGVIGEDKVTS